MWNTLTKLATMIVLLSTLLLAAGALFFYGYHRGMRDGRARGTRLLAGNAAVAARVRGNTECIEILENERAIVDATVFPFP
jgi:hypothetical protein